MQNQSTGMEFIYVYLSFSLNVVYLSIDAKLELVVGVPKQIWDGKEIDVVIY